MDSTIDRVFFVSHSLEFLHVYYLLFFEGVKLFSQASFFVFKDLKLELVYFLLLVDVDANSITVLGNFI